MVGIALKSALAYFITYGGNWLFGTCMAERPIIVGTVAGILLGDLPLGLMMGASLEAIFMGAVNIGGQVSADPAAATVFAVAFASQQNIEPNAALTLAIPIGVLSGFATMFVNNIFLTVLVPLMDKWAAQGNERGLYIYINFGVWLVKNIVFAGVVFLGVLAGHTAVGAFVDNIPDVVMTGLTVAGKFLPSVGLAILMKMLWGKGMAPYYFLGFILAIYLQLPIIAISVIGLILVLVISSRDIQLLRMEERLKIEQTTTNQSESDDSDVEDFLE